MEPRAIAQRLAVLDDARAHGYHVVTVGTTPMSRRVARNYGFVELGVIEVYEWTPAAN